MELIQAKAMVTSIFGDEELLALYAKGDELSHSQTKHDANHAFQVRDLAQKLTAEYAKRFPGKLTEWEIDVIIPLAAFLHDIGRAINVDNHAKAGAKAMNTFLRDKGFPDDVVKRVCKVIACHRSSIVLSREFDDPCWAIVVIADKCVGDEDRVRPGPAMKLRVLRFFSAVRFWRGSPHDRINFAIKQPEVIVDGGDNIESKEAGAISLKLDIDEKVASPADIYKLYGERFHACGRAAGYLGYVFRLEFNGKRFAYDKSLNSWVSVKAIKV